MGQHTIALFGAAERGEYNTPHYCERLEDLADTFGNPPEDSIGLMFAVQALMFDRSLIFFRVQEEGFSCSDYLQGLDCLRREHKDVSLSALCLPGVGDAKIIDASLPVCMQHQSLLLISEADLYDYLTDM